MKVKDIFMYALGALIVIGFFLIIYVMFVKPIPPENKDTTYLILGALVASFTTIVSYFYGSSRGSADKSETINNMKNEN